MRNPLYLDKDLLLNMADYYGVPLPEDAQVTRRRFDRTSKAGGLDKVVKASRETEDTSEVTEVFESRLRPVRLLNDVIDSLIESGDVADLVDAPDASIVHRRPILIEGDIEISPASAVAEYLTPMMSQLTDALASGVQSPELDLGRLITDVASTSARTTFASVVTVAEREEKFVVILNGDKMVGDVEDIQGELTVFGTVQKLVRVGSSLSLEKYLLPSLGRSFRRMIPVDKYKELLEAVSQPGESLRYEDLQVQGPACLVTPAAIYA